jgi:hypothetical protein
MATDALDKLIKEADQLVPDEQLRLLEHLSARARVAGPRRRWREICGAAPYPLLGEDAQEWVTRSREESEAHRQRRVE